MTNYRVTLTFSSNREVETLQAFFTKALSMGKMENAYVNVVPMQKAGRKAKVTLDVEAWVSKKSRKEQLYPAACAKATGQIKSTVWRIFQRMVEAGVLVRHESFYGPYYLRSPKSETARSKG